MRALGKCYDAGLCTEVYCFSHQLLRLLMKHRLLFSYKIAFAWKANYWISILHQLSFLLTPIQGRFDGCAVRCCLHVAGTWAHGSMCWAASQTLVFFVSFSLLPKRKPCPWKMNWSDSEQCLFLLPPQCWAMIFHTCSIVLLHYFSIPRHYWTWLVVVKCYSKDHHQTCYRTDGGSEQYTITERPSLSLWGSLPHN